MTDAEKLAAIAQIVGRQAYEQGADDGDKHLSDACLAMEAIEAVIEDLPDNPILRLYLPGGGS